VTAGGPGDHWRTDIFVWHLPVFGEPSDRSIRDIDRYGGSRLLDDDQPLGRRLGNLWPRWREVSRDDLQQLEHELGAIRDQLKGEALDRGWEVDQ